MNGDPPGLSVVTLGRLTRADHPLPVRRVLRWVGILLVSGFLGACDQAAPGKGSEPPPRRDDQTEVTRLREFVELLHREIEQLHKDKQRLTEQVERLQRENAALRAESAKRQAAKRAADWPARRPSPN